MVNKESPQHRRSLPAQPGLRDRGGNGRGSHSMGAYDREVGPHLLQLFGCSRRSRSTRVVVMTTLPLPAGCKEHGAQPEAGRAGVRVPTSRSL